MKNKRKNIIILLILILLLTLGIGVTYAIFKWTSSNSDITFNIEGCYVTYDAGGDITGASLGPALSKDDTNNVLSKKITLSPECSGVTANLTLKVNEIAPELKNTSFIWSLYEGNTKVSNGNFADATTNKVYTLLSTKTLTENTTTTYTLYIYIDGTVDNDSSMGGKNFKFTLGASGENALRKEPPVNAVTLVESLDDGTTEDSGSGVYKVQHDAIASGDSATGSEIPAVTDYRYYGPSPNNYICLDMEGQSTCPDKHLYRIIGSIYEEKENTNRIKVIKATRLTDGTTNGFSWGYKVNNGSDSCDNIWATITSGNYSNSLTSGSQLMKLLNSGAWWNGTSGSYYNNSTTATNVNFTNYKLSDKAKSYITTSRYYLGGYNNQTPLTNKMYGYERGTLKKNTDRPLYWEGMVGLMYPSDYGYAAGNTCVNGTRLYDYDGGCKNKDWLYISNTFQWLMSPDSSNSYGLFLVGYDGPVNYSSYSNNAFSVSPVFFLDSSASISDGEGTSATPYILS